MSSFITLPLTFVVVLLLLSISFAFERIAYEAVLPRLQLYGVSLGVLMAFAFNATKIGLAWYTGSESKTLRFTSVLARFIYIFLSLLASYLVFANFADSPELNRLLRAERARVTASFDAKIHAGRGELDKDIALVQQRYDKLIHNIQDSAQKRLDKLERDRKAEMHITDEHGNFIGRRYKEIMRQIKQTEQQRDTRIADLNRKEKQEIEALRDDWRKRESAIIANRDQAIAQINRDNLRDSEAAQSSWLTAGPHIANRIFGTHFDHTHFALLLSILAALAVEIGPLVLIVPVASSYSRAHRAAAGKTSKQKTLPPGNNPEPPARPLRAVD